MTKKQNSFTSNLYIFIVMAFMYLPILVMIIYSFNDSKSRGAWAGFTTKWYSDLIHNEAILTALWNTLIVAVISSVVATLLGTAAAVGIQAMKKRNRDMIMNFTYLPVMSPEIVMGVSLMLLFVMFGVDFSLFTVIIAHITFNVPYVILSVLPKLRQMDQYLFEAAMDLGCTPVQAFMKVMLPEILPGIISGFLIAFTFSLDDFNISYFVSGERAQTLPVLIYSMTRKRVSPEINALSAIIFVVGLAVLIITNLHDIRKEKQMQKGGRRG